MPTGLFLMQAGTELVTSTKERAGVEVVDRALAALFQEISAASVVPEAARAPRIGRSGVKSLPP